MVKRNGCKLALGDRHLPKKEFPDEGSKAKRMDDINRGGFKNERGIAIRRKIIRQAKPERGKKAIKGRRTETQVSLQVNSYKIR